MKTAAVVIDSWKLPIFKKHLDKAAYSYTEHPGPTPDTLILKVSYEWVHKLQPIVEKATEECRKKPALHLVDCASVAQ